MAKSELSAARNEHFVVTGLHLTEPPQSMSAVALSFKRIC